MSFKLAIVESKVQTVWIKTKGKKKNGDPKSGSAPCKIGTIVEFNDGNEIEVRETGKRFKGKGTRVRFNFKHGTISVQRPDTVDTTPSGAVVTTTDNLPIWVEQRESGFTEARFKAEFGKTLVELSYQGHNAALDEAIAAKAA